MYYNFYYININLYIILFIWFHNKKKNNYIYSTKVEETALYIDLIQEKFNFAFSVQQQIDSCDYEYERRCEFF